MMAQTARMICFNSQPLEGGCTHREASISTRFDVSTHSRSKAAASDDGKEPTPDEVSTHSRSKAAAKPQGRPHERPHRFNSQPLEGGCHPD